MPHYIDFESNITDPGLRGNPVHNGELPTRYHEVRGVRINGKVLTFSEEYFVENLHRALVEGPKLGHKNGYGFDCVAFALMMCGIQLGEVTGSDEFTADINTDFDFEFEGDDPNQRQPVHIGHFWSRFDDEPLYTHVAYPAHSDTTAQYIHKLGDQGPICLSSLDEAENIVRADVSAVIVAMTVRVGSNSVAKWQATR